MTLGDSTQHERRTPEQFNAGALRALAEGKPVVAREMLELALQVDAKNPMLWLNLAVAHQALSDLSAAMTAIEGALRVDPRFFLALLMKGSLLERQGHPKDAALAYGTALTQAPSVERLDPAVQRILHHARSINQRYVAELNAHIRKQIGAVLRGSGSAESGRIDLFVDAALGRKRIFRQEPTDFCYPGLPAIEFYENEEFPWMPGLESATANIQQELLQVLSDGHGFTPYIAYPDGLPLDQWTELNHSPRWSAFHFYHYGQRHEENCSRCPMTMDALADLPQPIAMGRMPAAMFSILKPKTRIPAHTGVANVRLVVHLPLIVPPRCGFRVGNQTREWRVGKAWVFDDTIEHAAWNDSDAVRVILICDVWSPRLSQTERELIIEVIRAIDNFRDIPVNDVI